MSTQTEEVKPLDGYYSIISPGTIHPNSAYNVVISVQDVKEPCKFVLKLHGGDFEIERTVEVQPMSLENIEFEIPDIKFGNYSLTAEGIAGLIFKESSKLTFEEKLPAIYIQTDKATYKPGDLVQFRVIFLDENIKPAHLSKPLVIYIKDAGKNRLKQYNVTELKKGVFSNKLQLSDFPVLGNWTIAVSIDGAEVYSKIFEVDKYVLPKFAVTVEAPKKVASCEEKFGLTVNSKYTYGKYVKGKATVIIKSFKALPAATPDQPCPIARPALFGGPPSCIGWNNYGKAQHNIEKTIELNGKAYFEFEMKNVLPDGLINEYVQNLDVEVTMEEELTAAKQKATAKIQVCKDRFNISAPYLLLKAAPADGKYKYDVTITNLNDEPISDDKNPVILSKGMFDTTHGEPVKAFLNQLGVASFELSSTEFNNTNIKIEYLGQISMGSIYVTQDESKENYVGLHVKPMEATLGERVTLQITTDQPLKYFVYTLVARANIVKSEFVTLTEDECKTHIFHIDTTFEMIPWAHVYVYYVEDGNLKYHEVRFNVKKQFVNKISLEAPVQTQPGDNIELKINTDTDSFVGLMGVDQSVLLLKSGNDFDKEQILQGLSTLQTSTPSEYRYSCPSYPGGMSGLITMTNAKYPKYPDISRLESVGGGGMLFGAQMRNFQGVGMAMPMAKTCAFGATASFQNDAMVMRKALVMEPPRIRKEFLENWFYDDIESTGDDTLTLSKKVPDTITSWVITGFSLNNTTGMALTEEPTKIRTFRPFFISTNLPYSIKRGEIVSIPIVLFNYMDDTLEAEITFDNSDDEFEFTDSLEDQSKRSHKLTVAANNGETIQFTIRPKKIGYITLKITAISPLAGDAIHKELKVEPEGVTIYKNRDYYVCLEENVGDVKTIVKLDIPNDIVVDSEHIEVSVMGDILSSTITNLDKLVRMPYGCGEQNMVNFVPNILVLRYLESLKVVNAAIETKAKHYLEVGYQRELTYKHDDGSYSAFGKSDKAGSTWLTAYVMRSFHQAAKYIDIDPNIMTAGLDFLASKQAANGSMTEQGKLFDFSHFNELGLTAFVLLALLENTEHIDKYKTVIARGLKFLEEQIKTSNDKYALALALYTLQLNKSGVVYEVLAKLDAEARIDGGLKWWTESGAEKQVEKHPWRPCNSHDVEITGYILMTLLDMNEPVLPVTKWLISQRNSNGGYTSTQETVVGLQALIKFAEKSCAGTTNEVDIEVSHSAAESEPMKFAVNKDNSMVMQTLELNQQAREITFNSTGLGTAIVQVSYRYNITDKEKQPSFTLETKVKPTKTNSILLMDVSAQFVPTESAQTEESNMAVMEVTLPSGYTAVQDSFDKIKEVEGVKRVETKNGDTNIIVYFDSLKKCETKIIPIEAELSHNVAEQKPVPIVIYDYYDSQKRATDFYQITSNLCIT